MINYPASYTDQYEIAMAQVYFLSGRKNDRAVFDYFFRKLPFGSGYCVFAGLSDLLSILRDLKFSGEDIDYLRREHHDHSFLEYLREFSFKGSLYSCTEGEIVFPNEPVMRVEGNLIEAQLIETLLLNIVNFESLIATKASRIRYVAGKKTLLEFGLRRAQGPGGYYATKASFIGGFDGTSFVKAASDFGISASGTMAHSFIQSSESELEAFRTFSELRPQDSVLLVDTYSTLESGLPNAIRVAKEMETKGFHLKGIRLDSGDLAYLSKECRKKLDEAGLHYVKIIASNQLDENVIQSLNEQHACFDAYGVGTKLVTGHPDGALDGVYKLSEINGHPRIKLSESMAKTSLPHKKQVYRAYDKDGMFAGADVVSLDSESPPREMHHPIEVLTFKDLSAYKLRPLLNLKMDRGQIKENVSLRETKAYCDNQLALLPEEYRRFTNPHLYKVGLSKELKLLRDELIKSHKENHS